MNGACFASCASSRGAFALLFPSTSSSSRLPPAVVSSCQANTATARAKYTTRASIWAARVGYDKVSGPSTSPSRLQEVVRAAKDAAPFSWPRSLQITADRAQAPWRITSTAPAYSKCYSDLLSGHAVLSRASRFAPPAAKGSLKKRPGGPTRPPLPSQPPRNKAAAPPPPPLSTPEEPLEEPPPPAPPPQNGAAHPPPRPTPPPSQPLPSVTRPSAGAPQGSYNDHAGGSPGSLSWYISQTDRLPTPVLVYGLIALNILIFLMWQYAMNSTATKQGDPTWPLRMFNNFLHSQRNWDEGRWWNVLTATFSHAVPQHLAMNMLSVALLAPALATKIGSAHFLGVYLLGGIAGSLASSLNFLYLEPKIHPKRKRPEGGYSTLGASGSVFAILSTLTFLDPKQGFMFFFIIPCTARVLLAGMTLNEVGGLWFGRDLLGRFLGGNTDHAAHLGGMVGGVAFWAWKLRGRRLRFK